MGIIRYIKHWVTNNTVTEWIFSYSVQRWGWDERWKWQRWQKMYTGCWEYDVDDAE